MNTKDLFKEKFPDITDTHRVFCPYRICPLGAHVDHQLGRVTGFAIDKGVEMIFTPTDDGSVEVYSCNYPGVTSFSMNEELTREFMWGDFIKGAIVTLRQKYEVTRGIKGVIRGELPVGGLSSSAAVIITYIQAFCSANDITMSQLDMVKTAQAEERDFIGVNVGKLDQSCEIYSRKDKLLFLDTLDDSTELVQAGADMPPYEFAIIFSGVERKLAGSAYNTRVDECKSAAYAMMAYAGMDYGKFEEAHLRDVPVGIYHEYSDKIPTPWRKRAKHFYEENARVVKGVEAWRKGDLVTFGQLVFESGYSSIHEYETGSKALTALYEIMKECDGIYGGRFSGAGFNGCSMAIVDPSKKEQITKFVTEKYLEQFPELKDSFAICYCKSADGVKIL